MIRRSAGLIAFGLTAVAFAQLWLTFAGAPAGRAFWIAMGIALAGCGVSALLTSGFAHVPKYLGRDLLGVGLLIAGFLVTRLVLELRGAPTALRGWELVGWFVAGYSFFLGSQRSFLVLLALDAFLLFPALAVLPAFPWAAAFFLLTVLLFAVLAFREKTEEIQDARVEERRWVPVKAGSLSAAVLLGLFALLYLAQPGRTAAVEGDPMDRLRYPGERRAPNGRELRLPNPIDLKYPPQQTADPFDRVRVAPEQGLDASVVTFRVDLKFGDITTPADRREAVVLLARVTADGKLLRPDRFPFYWKTGVVTSYDGRAWSAADRTPERLRAEGGEVRLETADPGLDVEQKIILHPMATRGLFALYPIRSIDLDEAWVDGEGTITRTRQYAGQFKYRVRSRIPAPTSLESRSCGLPERRHLDVPDSVAADPEFRRLSGEIARSSRTPYGRCLAVLEKLSAFRYTLTPRFPEAVDPTLEFLKRKRGYCQHFASAMALLLRSLGVPARIGVGFAGGDWDDIESVVVVRRRHAHSWVEVHFEGAGWIPFDPAGVPAEGFRTTPEPSPEETKKPEAPEKKDPPTEQPPDNREPGEKKPDPKEQPPGKKDEGRPVPDRRPPPDTDKPVKPPERRNPPENPGTERPDSTPVERTEPVSNFDRTWGELRNVPGGVSPPAGPTARGGAAGEGGFADSDYESASRTMTRVVRDLVLVLIVAIAVFVVVRFVTRVRKQRKDAESEWAPAGWGDGEISVSPDDGLEARVPSGTPRHRLVTMYVALLKTLRKLGLVRKASQTPREFAESVGGAPLASLTALFEEARYGGLNPAPEQLAEGRRMAQEVEREARRTRNREAGG